MEKSEPWLPQRWLLLIFLLAAGCAGLEPTNAQTPPLAATADPASHRATLAGPVMQAPEPPGTQSCAVRQASFQPAGGDAAVLAVDDLIAEVLARNPTLAQMIAAQQAAEARYPQVTSLEDPMLDLVLAPASLGSNSVDAGYRVGVSQKFPLAGKRGLRGQVAQAEARAAGNEVDDARLQLVESTRQAFYDLFLAYRAQAVNEENLNFLRQAKKSAENRFVTGGPEQEVFQLDVEVGRQGERTLTLQRMQQVAQARLNTLMHRPPESPLPPPPSVLVVPSGLPPVESLRAQALQQRPDLRALSDRIAAEEAALTLARREFYPELTVGAAYDTIMGNGPARDLAPQLSVGVNIPLRIEKRHAAIVEAQARLEQRRAEFARLVDQASFQIEEAYAQVAESEKIVRHYEKTILPASERNAKTARNAYMATKIQLIPYLEAERDFANLRDRYYQAQAEYFQRRATLDRALGEGVGLAGRTPCPLDRH
jgi:outer membrane protein TolC